MMLLVLLAMMRCLPKTLGEADIISEGNIISDSAIICRRQTSLKKAPTNVDAFWWREMDTLRPLIFRPLLAVSEKSSLLETSQSNCRWHLAASANHSMVLIHLLIKRKAPTNVDAFFWWREMDSNHRSKMQQIYSLPPLATREPLRIQLKSGAGDGTRTRNLLITNQLLCQLSYTSTGLGKSSIINFTLTIIT